MNYEIDIDLDDFSNEEIIEYAKDRLDMVEIKNVDLDFLDDDQLIDELNTRGMYVIEIGAMSIVSESLVDRFFELLSTESSAELLKRLI